jgi:hypothetical protein
MKATSSSVMDSYFTEMLEPHPFLSEISIGMLEIPEDYFLLV